MIMKLRMVHVNTLEHCICCDMTKQYLKEGIPHLSMKLYIQLAYTSITVQHSKKPKQKNNDYEIRNGKYFGILHLL